MLKSQSVPSLSTTQLGSAQCEEFTALESGALLFIFGTFLAFLPLCSAGQ